MNLSNSQDSARVERYNRVALKRQKGGTKHVPFYVALAKRRKPR